MKLRYEAEDLYDRFDRVMRSMAISSRTEHEDSRLRKAYLTVLHQTFGKPEEVDIRTANKMVESLTNTIQNFQASLHLEDSDIREIRTLLYKEVGNAFGMYITVEIEEE